MAPTDLTAAQLAHAQRIALAAYRALRVEGLARVDLFLQPDDEIVVNEVNTMPGFTPISMFPMLWEAEGLSFAAVIDELVRLGPGPPRPPRRPAHPPPRLTRSSHRPRPPPPGSLSGRLAVPSAGPAGRRPTRSATIGAGQGTPSTPSVPCGVW